ncbi:MAG: hypothetical protein ACXADL_16385 [Candidatus Thorarchaeota archaeon]
MKKRKDAQQCTVKGKFPENLTPSEGPYLFRSPEGLRNKLLLPLRDRRLRR